MHVYHYCPLPPARNGIADYAARVNLALQSQVELTCVNANPFSEVPTGVPIIDPQQDWRHAGNDVLPIYQIGNNGDHIDIYRKALNVPGLVILHDLRLFYLHELLDVPKTNFAAMMLASNPIMARVRLDDVIGHWRKLGTDYFCFDMIWDLLRRSRKVMVHSHYARNILIRTYGDLARDRVTVIPHFALQPDPIDTASVRERLGIAPGTTLFVSSGFATKAKRFDWVAPALARMVRDGHDIAWLHAGASRPEEFDLEGLIREFPELSGRARVTGFLSEEDLDAHLSVADIVLNLRFPSVGESSGTLARAFAAGRCCVVTRTAAYDEIPEDAVVKVSPFDPVNKLSKALGALLTLPDAQAAFGRNAMHYATTTLSVETYTNALMDLCQQAALCQPHAQTAFLDRPEDSDCLTLGPFDADSLDPRSLASALPGSFLAQSLKLRGDASNGYMLDAIGLDASRQDGDHD